MTIFFIFCHIWHCQSVNNWLGMEKENGGMMGGTRMRKNKEQVIMSHNNQKKIAVINDISGFGRCSIAVAMPIISYMGAVRSLLPFFPIIPDLRAFITRTLPSIWCPI